MSGVTPLSCRCGTFRMEVEKAPIMVVECYCTSCRTAGATLEGLPGASPVMNDNGGTPFVVYRKDRVRFLAGQDQLREHRVKSDSSTRRVVAACCNTPVFLEFQNGHWLSIY